MTAVNFTYDADSTGYTQSLGEMITATSNFGAASKTVTGTIAQMGVSMSRLTANLLTSGRAYNTATQMAAAYEQKLSSLEARTVVAGKSFDVVGRQIREMARDLPGGIDMAARQVEVLQRMGVTSEKALVPIAREMTKIGAANAELGPGLTASLTQLSKTFETLNVSQVDKLGDSLTAVSSKAGASATGVTDFANAVGPLGQTLGLTQTQVMGFSAGFAAAGQEGYLAANVFNRMMGDMERSAREGTAGLQVYADTVGMTSRNFQDLVKSNPAEALVRVFEALNTGGSDSLRTLEQLNLDAPRTMKTIQAVAQSSDLRSAVETAMAGYGDGSAEKGAEAAFGGLNDEMARSQEIMQQLTEAAGRPMLGVFTQITKATNSMGSAFAGLANSDVVQKLTGLAIGLGAVGSFGVSALKAGVTMGFGKQLLSAPGIGMRGAAGQAADFIKDNKTPIMLGGLGAAGAGAAMDSSFLTQAGMAALLLSSFAPTGMMGKGMSNLRKAAGFLGDMMVATPAMYSTLSMKDIRAGKSPYDADIRNVARATGMSESRVWRRFGGDSAAAAAALRGAQGANANVTFGSLREEQAAMRAGVLGQAPDDQARLLRRMSVSSAGNALKGLGMGTAALASMLPWQLMAPVAAVAGGAFYGYAATKEANKYEDMAKDEGASTMRNLSQKYGIQMRPMERFVDELERATEAVTTWGDAVKFSADRAEAARNIRGAGIGGQKLVVGDRVSQNEVIAQMLTGGALQSPEFMAALTNDVAAQRSVREAEAAAAEIEKMRRNPQKALSFVTKQIATDVERGWQAPFMPGYSGKKENVEMAGGYADQMRTDIEREEALKGQAGVGQYKRKQLDQIEKDMLRDLESGSFDAEVYEKLLAPLVGPENARAYVNEFKGNNYVVSGRFGGFNPLAWFGALGRVTTDTEVMDKTRKKIERQANRPVTNPQLRKISRLGSGSAQATASALRVAKGLDLTPEELADIAENGADSEYISKLGLGRNATREQVDAALESAGFGAAEATALQAFRTPENMIRQYQQATAQVSAAPGGALEEYMRIRKDLMSGKSMPPAQREALEGQMAAIEQYMLPLQLQGMSSQQQRNVQLEMAQQTIAYAQKNPESERAQEEAAKALQVQQQMEMENDQYLKNRLRAAFEYSKARTRAEEDYQVGVQRANEEFQIQMLRAEEEFQIQRARVIEEYNINVERAQEDHKIQMQRLAEDTAKGMLQPFQVLQSGETWGLSGVTQNIREQTRLIEEAMDIVDDLRDRGLSQEAIDLLDLSNPANARAVTGMYGASKAEIEAANRAAERSLETGEEVAGEQVGTRRYQEDFRKGLRRGEEDLNRSLRNSEKDFRRSMRNSREDFQRNMRNQAQDMRRQMKRMRQDFLDMDKEFIADKETAMKKINDVVRTGSARWKPIVRKSMDDVVTETDEGYTQVKTVSRDSINYLYDIWAGFAVDGQKPGKGTAPKNGGSGSVNSGTASGSTNARQNPGARGSQPSKPSPQPPSKPSNPGARGGPAGKSGKKDPDEGAGAGEGGAGGVVTGAGSGKGTIWNQLAARWQKLFDVIKEYGWESIAGAGGVDIPSGGTTGGMKQNAKWLYRALIGDGYTEAQAAGILGNLQQESGFNPKAIQAGGPGRGLAQWSEGERWAQLQAWASKQGLNPWDVRTQYGFMRKEMNENWGNFSDAQFRGIRTVGEAADYFGKTFEVYGDAGSRVAYAKAWFNELAGKGLQGFASGSTNAKKETRGLWEIGDDIFRAGKAAEQAAAAGTGPGYAPKFIGGIKVGVNEDIGDIAAVMPFTGIISGTNYRSGNAHRVAWRDTPNWGVVDIGQAGHPVYAYAYGQVVHAGPFSNGSYSPGSTVDIVHLNKGWTRYAHLGSVKVNVGDIVAAGDKLGTSGSDHLHFEWTGMPSLTQREAYGAKAPWLARGGIVTQAQMAMVGEAGHEAVIPLNSRGVDALAEAIGRYSTSYEARKARAMQYSIPVTAGTTVYNEDHSTNFTGNIEVKADDPREMMGKIDAERRRRNLYAPTRSRR